MDRLARSMGLDTDGVNVTELARRLGGLAGERLDACRRSLRQRLETVGRLNREVGDLIACGLRLVQGTMALINQLIQPGRIYHRSGTVFGRHGAADGSCPEISDARGPKAPVTQPRISPWHYRSGNQTEWTSIMATEERKEIQTIRKISEDIDTLSLNDQASWLALKTDLQSIIGVGHG